jgi:hypothetical protein
MRLKKARLNRINQIGLYGIEILKKTSAPNVAKKYPTTASQRNRIDHANLDLSITAFKNGKRSSE